MTDETIIPSLDEATRAEIRRELEIARTKYGDRAALHRRKLGRYAR
jgi:hypothetical protein